MSNEVSTKEIYLNTTDTTDKTLPSYDAAINSPATDSLPSYDSVITQLRRAKEDAKSPVDYLVKACGIICGSLIVTIIFAISAAIPIAMIVVGSIYIDQCPINNKIPIWLIVAGVFGLLSSLFRSISNCFSLCKKRENDDEKGAKKSWLISLIELFLFIWLICGSVWVYSIRKRVTSDSSDMANYCNQTCYLFAFWIITITYIFMALTCCCLCCVIGCFGCGLSLSALASKSGGGAQNP